MLKLLQAILAFLAIVAVQGDGFTLQYKGNMKHPDLSDHCYYADYNLTIPVKETSYPTNLEKACIKVLCRDDYVLEIRHCQHPDLDHCKLASYDYTKPFPACCPTMTCHGKVYRTQDDI